MGKEIDKAKNIFKEAFEVLSDYFEEKRSDTVTEEEKKAKRGKVALAKFSKGLIGKTDKINFRILIGEKKEMGDYIYEAVYLSDKKEPKIYVYKINNGKPCNTILLNFKEDDWNGYKKVEKYKSLTKFLESAYKDGIYYKGKKEKKEDALNKLVKGLKRSLEAVEDDEKAKKGEKSPIAIKIAKVVAVAAVTTIVSAALTPAAGIIAQEIAGGGSITGDVLGSAAQAAGEGLKSLADPVSLAKKVVTKAITKGKDLPGTTK
ncbi:MAG: hypothetical protein JSV62_04850 [Promethearchaeota archaeon]|nr:MAG: hypothetical protein JSV62_04850 [Candidatus Lokiarchaeota archaeon]